MTRDEEIALRAENAQLRALVASLQDTLATLQKALDTQTAAFEGLVAELKKSERRLFGKSSEKMPSAKKEIAEADGKKKPDPEKTKAKRANRREQRDQLAESDELPVPVPPEKRCCPHCQSRALKVVGDGRLSRIIEYRAPKFVYENYRLETLACPCGEYVVTAESPARVFDKSPFGPRLIAHVIVTKLLDSIPSHRLEKLLARQGVLLSRQTMTDLIHRAAELLEPLVMRMLALIATAEIVQADETSQRRQDSEKRGFVWTFLAEIEKRPLVAYRFAADRSGETPVDVLGSSAGYLVADMYSGYNEVTAPKRRRRAACWAHVRRRFHELQEQHPEAREMLDAILELYRIEYAVEEDKLLGTEEHLARRLAESFPVVLRIRMWLRHRRRDYPPKSQMAKAIRYTLGNLRWLMTFLHHPGVRLDNNRSEGALRPVALGRKNFLFVGHEEAGENLAVLLSLVMSAVANGLNPEEYLADVLLRVATHPAAKIDELLPHRWQRAA